MISFDKQKYTDALLLQLYTAVVICTDLLKDFVKMEIAKIELSKGDQKQGFTTAGMQGEVFDKILPRTYKQLKGSAEKMIKGHVYVAGGSQSIVAVFYEYGTGSKSTAPSGRWKHMQPNPVRQSAYIEGRPANRPQGVKLKDYKGVEYSVIKGAHGAVLKHTTKGTRAGHKLPQFEVSPHMFMLKAMKQLKPHIEKELAQAIKRVNIKKYFKFKDVKIK